MKKLGTPMRAAPGSASETVGFSSVGEPSVLRVGFSVSGVDAPLSLDLLSRSSFFSSSLPSRTSPLSSAPPTTLPGFGFPPPMLPWFPPPPPPPVLPALSPLPMFPGVGVAVTDGAGVCVGDAVAVGVGVGVETGPRSTTVSTGAGSGGNATSWTDVPAGTSTVSSTLWPFVSCTDRRCSSAEAEATTTAYRAAAASAMSSVRRLIYGCEYPPSQYRHR